MSYKVNNLMYAAGKNILNTICTAITFTEPVDKNALVYAVNTAFVRFPYFCVRLVCRGEEYVMEHNDAPFVITYGTVGAALGSEENNYHLFSITYTDDTVYVHTSHYITDGNGKFPLLRTLVYLYLHRLHPDEEFDTRYIALPESDISAEEMDDAPYPNEPLPYSPIAETKRPCDVLKLNDLLHEKEYFSFCLSINQKELMNYVSSVDGSPATFITALMYKTITTLHPEEHLPVVCGMQHQFRKALGKPYSHLCHTNIVPMVYPDILRGRDIERLNTMSRGMLLIHASDENDVLTVNKHIENTKKIKELPLAEKCGYMSRVLLEGIGDNTFEVSYTGRVPWCGLDKYIKNVAPYIDMSLSGGISVEIFSVGERFDINIMQKGNTMRYFEHVCKLLDDCGIAFAAASPVQFKLCGFCLP